MMKKRYAVVMMAAMMTGLLSTTVLAEGPGADSGMQISGPQMPGSQEMGQAPQMNGQAPQGEMPQMSGQAPQGEAPQMNGQAPQGEAPQMNGQAPQGEMPQMNGQAPQGEAPQMNGQAPQMSGSEQMPRMKGNGRQPRMKGKGAKNGFGFISFEKYVTDGTISKETYEAITKFMEENKPELPEGTVSGERPENASGEKPELKEGDRPDLLKDLLNNGIITQEEYDALAAAREADRPAAPAADQSAEGTQTGDATAAA